MSSCSYWKIIKSLSLPQWSHFNSDDANPAISSQCCTEIGVSHYWVFKSDPRKNLDTMWWSQGITRILHCSFLQGGFKHSLKFDLHSKCSGIFFNGCLPNFWFCFFFHSAFRIHRRVETGSAAWKTRPDPEGLVAAKGCSVILSYFLSSMAEKENTHILACVQIFM